MTRTFALPCAAALAIALALPVALDGRQSVVVKIGTIAPDNSPWTNAIRSMGAAWAKATDKRVDLRLYPSISSDKTAISRMALDSLQGATLFVAGLAEIDQAFNVFAMPFMFESDAELEFVQKELGPMLEQRLAAKKYRLLTWANGGWVRLFSKQPLKTVAEIQAAKLYTTSGDPSGERWFAQAGFHVVPLETSQIPVQLKNPLGSINAAPSPPVYAAAAGFYKDAPYMLDLRLGPFTTATVMTEAAWSKISAGDQAKVKEAAVAMGKEVSGGASALDTKYIDEMKKNGLNIVALDAKAQADFKTTADRLMATQRGSIVPADVYDAAMRARDAFRKTKR
jgi:TRAP-type C4-dicarboxylate transport system substrate-binding protein